MIGISPFDEKNLGPNSYNVRLFPTLRYYTSRVLDPKINNPSQSFEIPEDGYLLFPRQLVIGCTEEICTNNANNLVPMIEGRSSLARLGLSVHSTAGFGDIGFCGRWTLEISCVVPIILYPNMPVAQLYWLRCSPSKVKYRGKYQSDIEPGMSKIFKEFE